LACIPVEIKREKEERSKKEKEKDERKIKKKMKKTEDNTMCDFEDKTRAGESPLFL